MAISTKNKNYDYLIVGSGPEALLTALILQGRGLTGAIVEKEENVGGLYRPLRYLEQQFDSQLTFWPDTAESIAALEFMQAWIPDLTYTREELGALTFHNGQVQPFMGFGEHHVAAADEYSFFTQPNQLTLSKSTSEIVTFLRDQFTGDVYTQNEATQIAVEESPFVLLNGSQRLGAKDIYFFESPHVLAKLLGHDPASKLSKPAVLKLSKVPLWTALTLTFHHKQEVTQSPAMHILYGAKEQPSLGRVFTQNGLPISQWLCFLNDEAAADNEFLGATIREMKKQVKRMYPFFTDTVEKEFISVAKNSYGSVPASLLDKNYQLAKAPSLHLGSRFYSGIPGLLGDITSVLRLFPIVNTAPEVAASEEAIAPL
jgi:hypothetical protein